jgi:hypothetical protein
VRFFTGKAGMYKKSFTVLVMFWGIFTTENVALSQGEGDKYVQDSLKMLLSVQTVECDLRIETFVDGKEYTARGRYEEQALPRTTPHPFLRSMYRLEINFPMANDSEPNRMTLVCHPSEDRERNQIERYTFIEGDKSFSTIDLTKLEERLKAVNKETVFAQVSEVRNLGGLAGTMRQISRFYEFSAPTQENLQDEEAVPTWKLTGTIRGILHKELLARFGGLDKKGRYPADFPSDIEIWIGRHNDFPYKIRYLCRISEMSRRKELVLQESFYKVNLNGTPLPASRFAPLNPPEDVFSDPDDTDNFIKSLGL